MSRLKVKNRSNRYDRCDKPLAVSIPILLRFLSKLCSLSTAQHSQLFLRQLSCPCCKKITRCDCRGRCTSEQNKDSQYAQTGFSSYEQKATQIKALQTYEIVMN